MLIIRPGLLDQLKHLHGIKSDTAMAARCGVPLDTYRAYRDGTRSPSGLFMATIGREFNIRIAEIATTTDPAAKAA